jgi:hypothetical protein
MGVLPDTTGVSAGSSPETLLELLDMMRPGEGDSRVSVADVLARVGGRSFPAVLLIPCIILVSPVSGIPGMPTVFSLIVLVITLQGLVGRRHLWLPGFLRNRSISADRMTRAIAWLSRPAEWMDRYSRNRLRILTNGPTRFFAYAATAVMAASWPLLELLPFVTSFSAGAIAMIMYGLMVRDGAYTLAGYVQGGVIYTGLLSVWAGIL